MTLSKEKKNNIKSILKESLRNKFKTYKPESDHMPFHFKLLGKDRMALYSFIHSLNTNFGSSIFEPVAKILALEKFKIVLTQQKVNNEISSESQNIIQDIMNNLSTVTKKPNKPREIKLIRSKCQTGTFKNLKSTKVDIKLVDFNDDIYLIDLKTAKPNKGSFKEFKRTLLEWVAVELAVNPKANIQTLIAIPYNPYEPEKYNRWTMAGMLDLEYELKVAEEFWDFLGGKGAYQILLNIFEDVGIEMRDEINKYFLKFK